MSVQYHQTFAREASLDSDFGLNLAIKKLAVTQSDIDNLLGRYTKGKHKGKFKGCLVWDKTEVGGWDRSTQSVIKPGSRNYRICKKVWVDGGSKYETVLLEKQLEPEIALKPLYKYLVDGLSYESTLSNPRDIAEEFNSVMYKTNVTHLDVKIDTRGH